MRLVLASSSPRRRELLARLGWPFIVLRPDIDETPFAAEPADVYVARLSREKALIVPAEADDCVIAADTTVTLDGEILGKPADAAEAIAMLTRLGNHRHTVYTGMTVRIDGQAVLETTTTATEVILRDYSTADIVRYVESGAPFDKAGGYAIQDRTFQPVAQWLGCYANVMGLPLCTLDRMLAACGLIPPQPVSCRADQPPCIVAAADALNAPA